MIAILQPVHRWRGAGHRLLPNHPGIGPLSGNGEVDALGAPVGAG